MNDPTLSATPDARQAPDPDLGRIVDQLTPRLGQPGGAPQPLGGGITNRNYRMTFGGAEYVVRVPGKDTDLLGIDRGVERAANERAAKLGIAPSVAVALDDPACIVTAFVKGDVAEPETLRDSAELSLVARLLRTLHDSPGEIAARFDCFGIAADYEAKASERGVKTPAALEVALDAAKRIEPVMNGPEHELVPCHNDLLAANFIAGDGRLWIVDWEYSGMNDRYFDLANFAVNCELDDAAATTLLADYFEDPSDEAMPRRLAKLRLMTVISDLREAMWGVLQSAVSDIEFDFEGYAGKHFDRLGETVSSDEFEGWLDAAGANGH